MPLLRLIRLPNLLVVALTQVLIFYRVIKPALLQAGLQPAFSDWRFFELVLATCIVTAGGYIINDLFDQNIDRINHPQRIVLDRITAPVARWLYGCLLLGGFILSTLIAFRRNELAWLWLYPFVTMSLALYSPVLKRRPLVSNLLVAVYCAGVAGLLWLAEREALTALTTVQPETALAVRQVLIIFMIFAFGSTLLREIVKDIEDMEGDRQFGRQTLPILLGTQTSRWLTIFLGVLLLLSLTWPLLQSWSVFSKPLLEGTLLILGMWLLLLIYQLTRARVKEDFHRLSTQLKFFMLGGLCLLLLVQF